MDALPLEDQKFMAHESLVQWAQAVVDQGASVTLARNHLTTVSLDHGQRRKAILAFHTECHFFVIAAYKLIEFRQWAANLGLFRQTDFGEIDSFSAPDIRDLRNMREHVVQYYQGAGHAGERWLVETPEFRADASSVNGTSIGGRLDWIAFAAAVDKNLPSLIADPTPLPVG